MESNCISVVMKTPCLYARVAESVVESAKESTCISVAMNNAILYGRAAESVPESATESAFVCIVHKPCFQPCWHSDSRKFLRHFIHVGTVFVIERFGGADEDKAPDELAGDCG